MHRYFHVGQGISRSRLEIMIELLKKQGIDPYTVLLGHETIFNKASKEIVHKHKIENVLISTPVRIEKNRFKSDLVIDEECAEMSDHITGQHLQGMLLIEAARQMMTATYETHILPEVQQQNMNFILNSIRSNFKNFVFPLPVSLELEIINHRKMSSHGYVCSIKVFFTQELQIVHEIEIDFSIFSPIIFSSVERRVITSLSKVLETFSKNRTGECVL